MCNCIPRCKDRKTHIKELYEKLRIAQALPVGLRDTEYVFGLKFVIKYETEKLKEGENEN